MLAGMSKASSQYKYEICGKAELQPRILLKAYYIIHSVQVYIQWNRD
jgi:hypothetical protein